MSDILDQATKAIATGNLVVYPTETVYGLGAAAMDVSAVDRVFTAKSRPRTDPISMAVPDAASAFEYTRPTDRERAFVREFLPGPVTVVLERTDAVPGELTAGTDRVGIRIPDHESALSLLDRVAPITATSANVSGNPGATRVSELDPEIEATAAVVIDDGGTPGGGSTVVDVAAGTIHRRGRLADEVDDWLARN